MNYANQMVDVIQTNIEQKNPILEKEKEYLDPREGYEVCWGLV